MSNINRRATISNFNSIKCKQQTFQTPHHKTERQHRIHQTQHSRWAGHKTDHQWGISQEHPLRLSQTSIQNLQSASSYQVCPCRISSEYYTFTCEILIYINKKAHTHSCFFYISHGTTLCVIRILLLSMGNKK